MCPVLLNSCLTLCTKYRPYTSYLLELNKSIVPACTASEPSILSTLRLFVMVFSSFNVFSATVTGFSVSPVAVLTFVSCPNLLILAPSLFSANILILSSVSLTTITLFLKSLMLSSPDTSPKAYVTFNVLPVSNLCIASICVFGYSYILRLCPSTLAK